MTTFWSLYITALTLGTLLALTWLIFATRKGQRSSTTDETVGHSYDGIEEYDNPLPKWWFMLFVGTLVFAVGYLALYPDGHTAPVEIRGAVRRGPAAGGEILLLAAPVCPDAASAAAGQGAPADPAAPRGALSKKGAASTPKRRTTS